jgi:hypothetical protein
VEERQANLFAAKLFRVESLFKPRIETLNPAFESFEQDHLLPLAGHTPVRCSTVLASRQRHKRKRIFDAKAEVLIVDQVKAAVPEGTAVRFDLSEGEGIK